MVMDVLVILGLQVSLWSKVSFNQSSHNFKYEMWYTALWHGLQQGATAARTIKLPRLLGWLAAVLWAAIQWIWAKCKTCRRCGKKKKKRKKKKRTRGLLALGGLFGGAGGDRQGDSAGQSSDSSSGSGLEVQRLANKLVYKFTEKLVLMMFALTVMQAAARSLSELPCSQRQMGLQTLKRLLITEGGNVTSRAFTTVLEEYTAGDPPGTEYNAHEPLLYLKVVAAAAAAAVKCSVAAAVPQGSSSSSSSKV
jgi:hypothetical protein